MTEFLMLLLFAAALAWFNLLGLPMMTIHIIALSVLVGLGFAEFIGRSR